MTPALPLPLHDGENTQAIFDLIAKSAIDTGGRSIKLRFGTSSVTFTASPTSAQVTIAHGMGSTPTLAAGFARTPTNARVTVQESAAASATNIFLTGFISDAVASSVTQSIYWIAIG